MSTYGTYINGEDPNKKDPNAVGATTPTTPPVLTYEGFIGTGTGSNAYQAGAGVIESTHTNAVNTATTNRDLGYSYAEGVRNSIYGSAEATRAQMDANTELARQRGIIDSQSAYQKAIGTYGANAETLAGRGLSGSGYGEYLTADAYATHRGQVQDINAGALAANREAAYNESQTKQAADSEYLKTRYGIDTEYNNAISKADSDKTMGLYELGLGLGESQNKAYSNLFNSASQGVSIDVIKQDGTWGDLTPEQQKAIIAEADRYANDKSVNEFKGLIDGGTSLEEIQKSEAWAKLTPTQQTAISNYYNNKAEADVDANYNTALGLLADEWTVDEIKAHLGEEAVKALTDSGRLAQIENAAKVMSRIKSETEGKTANEKLLTYVDLALDGMDIDTIQKIAESLGHYDVLSAKKTDGTSLWDAVTDEAEKKSKETEATNNANAVQDMIDSGASAEEIKGSEEYSKLDDPTKAKVDDAIEQRDESIDNYANYVVTDIRKRVGDEAIKTEDDLIAYLNTYTDDDGHLLSNDIREKITTKWQSANAEFVIEDIRKASVTKGGLVSNGEEYTGIEIANDIKNGVYGDNAQAVVDAYCEFIYNNLDAFLNIHAGASYALSQALNIGPLASEWAKKISAAINQKTGYTAPTTSSTTSDGSVYSAAGIVRSPNPFPGGK